MILITALGLASMVFTAAFTYRAYRAGDNPRAAIIEAWANLVIGFSINYVANMLLLPIVGASITLAQNFWLGWTYTAISILRQYVIRRHFQERIHQAAQRLASS